jgi:endonuclease G, mitochondrial
MKKIFKTMLIIMALFILKSNTFDQKINKYFSSESLLTPYIRVNDIFVKYHGFSLVFNETHKQAEWVTYFINNDRLISRVKRSNDFRPDSNLKTATHSDYNKSAFDRGHLAPAGDMSWSKKSMSESFLYSNMSPQRPGFNRGIWKKLEDQVRKWVNDSTELNVTTGPILIECLPKIGDGVSVPEFYYKAIIRKQPNRIDGIAFVMSNTTSNKELYEFAITIDSLEILINTNLHYQLEESVQKIVESEIELDKWFKLN